MPQIYKHAPKPLPTHNSNLSIPIPIPNSKFLLAYSQKQARFQYFSPSLSNLSPASRVAETFSTKPPRREHKVERCTSALAWVFFYQQRTPALSGHAGLPCTRATSPIT